MQLKQAVTVETLVMQEGNTEVTNETCRHGCLGLNLIYSRYAA